MRTEETPRKSVLVVIVNYRSAGLAIDCLRSLAPEIAANPSAKVALVENASGDDSADQLARAIESEGWGGWVELIVAANNGGFAAGNNLAIRPALNSPTPPDLVWLLNPDTIVRPGALGELIDFLDRRPEAGLVGSRLECLDGTPQFSAFNFPSIRGELVEGLRLHLVTKILSRNAAALSMPTGECQVDWVAGASLMIRRAVFDAVGVLDDGYFMYFEEVDFCLKASRAGWPCWYAPGSRVVHLVGQSSGVTNPATGRKRRPRYWFDARRRYFVANHGRLRSVAADLTFALAFGLYRVRAAIQRKPDNNPQWFLRDFVRYSFFPMKFSR